MDVYLFDIDAVLLHPGGYRAALHATLRHFAQQLGLSAPLLTAEQVEVFEAHSIISEWDISAICMAAVVLEALLAAPALAVPATLPAALAALRKHGALQPDISPALLARSTSAALRPGEYAAQAAARVLASDVRVAADARSAALCALLDHILLHTRDPQQSLTFRIFRITRWAPAPTARATACRRHSQHPARLPWKTGRRWMPNGRMKYLLPCRRKHCTP